MLDDTAGSIEAAIIMEYGKNGDYFEYYDMFYEGLNGQLPNLDLLNTANVMTYHEQIPVPCKGCRIGLSIIAPGCRLCLGVSSN